MNNNLTEIIYVLDRSGSMWHLADDAVGGYNAFLAEQRAKEDGEYRITTVLFNDKAETIVHHLDVRNASDLTAGKYDPNGMTALLDAVGITIDGVGKYYASLPEDERPGKVIFLIMTDGLENCSIHYSRSQIQEMIQHQETKYNWTFLLVGAGIDAYEASADIGIAAINTVSVSATDRGISNMYTSMSNAVNCVCDTGVLDASYKAGLEDNLSAWGSLGGVHSVQF